MPTAFESHKRKLYTLRILRELEPSILIALSLFSYTSSLWAARSGASYSSAMMNPWRSQALDKAAWHFAITSGETDPVTGNAYWQEVDVLDVYTNQQVADIESGALKQWPKTKSSPTARAEEVNSSMIPGRVFSKRLKKRLKMATMSTVSAGKVFTG